MLPRDDRIRLQHLLEAAQRLTDFVRGRTAAELSDDHQLAYAVGFGLAVIGEAANHVSTETRAHLPRVPWPQVIRMRNRLIHAYSDINAEVVWETILRDLPELIRMLDDVLDEGPPFGGPA